MHTAGSASLQLQSARRHTGAILTRNYYDFLRPRAAFATIRPIKGVGTALPLRVAYASYGPPRPAPRFAVICKARTSSFSLQQHPSTSFRRAVVIIVTLSDHSTADQYCRVNKRPFGGGDTLGGSGVYNEPARLAEGKATLHPSPSLLYDPDDSWLRRFLKHRVE